MNWRNYLSVLPRGGREPVVTAGTPSESSLARDFGLGVLTGIVAGIVVRALLPVRIS